MSRWDDLFCKQKDSYIEVKLTHAEKQMLSQTAQKMAAKENTEFVYSLDNWGISARWFVGLVGEYAVSKVLLDWGLIDKMPTFNLQQGFSSIYDTADLLKCGFNLGCKTSTIGRVIKVKENCKYSEVVCVYDKYQNVCYVCGIATSEVLDRYADIDLIEDEVIRRKSGTVASKVGFDRFDKLIPFTKENVERYRIDLKIQHLFFLQNQERLNLIGNCTYIEKKEDTLVFRHSQKGVITETVVDYPFTHEGLKKLTKTLKPNHIYLGFQILPILEKLQSEWVGLPLTIQLLDLWEVLNQIGGKFDVICKQTAPEEALGLLSMLYKPVLPYPMDEVNTNFYTLLWILTR